MLKAATKLQIAKDNWQGMSNELDHALTYNRKLWTVLSTSATTPENPLPLEIKNNIANLAVFIFKRSLELQFEPAPEKLSILVTINRNIAAGLSGR